MGASEFPYLHGFSAIEQERLRKQATFWEHLIYQNVNFSGVKNLLEVGSGVGAQSEILLRRFPQLELTCVELSKAQIEAAKQTLANVPWASNRYSINEMDASNLDFESNTFDGAFLCWVLEHVPDPARVLAEVRRVLRPGARVVVNEVMNHTFFLEPYSPNVWKYWMAFNDFQFENAGDPFIGAKLGNLLTQVGYRSVKTQMIDVHLDNRMPEKRKQFIEFWSELLLSAKDQLLSAGSVDEETVEKASKELSLVRRDPNAVFMYSFMQAKATVWNDGAS